MSVNKVILVGNVGADPDIRDVTTGRVANFSVATSEKWKDKRTGEQREKTEWHKVFTFQDGLIGVIERYVKKGDKVYIEGKLQTEKWQDSNGQDRYTTKIALVGFNSQLELLGDRKNGGNRPSGSGQSSGRMEDIDDEIPF